MAGTIVSDTIQNGAGASAPTTTVINGSAKAWVNFNGSTSTIRSSFNVSSITNNGTGDFTVNFTNALADANYSSLLTGSAGGLGYSTFVRDTSAVPTTTALRIGSLNTSDTPANPTYFNVAVFD